MWAGSSEIVKPYNRAALIGTGLIGGSIGLALREKHLVGSITGYDRDRQTCLEAVARGAVDRAAESPGQAARGADLVIVAVPVMSTVELVKEILPVLAEGALVTDVGSTKGSIMSSVEPLLPAPIHFVGGHPMAGSEESGIGGADPALLENTIYVLTPGSGTPQAVVERFSAIIAETGAQPITLDPFEHDRLVAAVSHLPHLAAASLVRSIAGTGGDPELLKTLAAGGFRDSTRIALGNPEVWRDICVSNRWALLPALRNLKAGLDYLEQILSEPDPGAVEEYLRQARDYRRTVPHRGRGILPDLYELTVLVRDNPGAIGSVAGLLGEAGINIDAIEIMHVRELAGGSIRLGFRSGDQQRRARTLLGEKGYTTHGPAYSP